MIKATPVQNKALVLEALQSSALRAEIGALPGYDVSGMGTVHLDLPLPASSGEQRRRASI